MLPLQRAWVLSLVRELRSHMLYGMAKKEKLKDVGGGLPLAVVANTFLIVGYPDCRNGGWTETNSLLTTDKSAAFLKAQFCM